MKRRLIEFLIIIFFICSKSYALPVECRQLFDAIKKESTRSDLANVEYLEFLDLGFEFKLIYNEKENEWYLNRNKDGYLTVGRITNESIADKLKYNDEYNYNYRDGQYIIFI